MTFIVNCFPKSRFGRPHVQPEYHDILPSQPTIQNLLHVQMQIIKKQQQKNLLYLLLMLLINKNNFPSKHVEILEFAIIKE